MTNRPKNLAVLRIAKITSISGLAGASAHNTRSADAGLDHAKDHASQMGGGVQLLTGSDDAVAAWRQRCDLLRINPADIRKDAVRAIELVMSASPEWFANASDQDRITWRDRSLAWASDFVGSDNILQATIHDDEDTPHLHVLAIPARYKERRKAGRPRKGRSTAKAAPEPSWGLSAADLIGTRQQMTAHQTSYASKLTSIGIRRGIPRRSTGARHQPASVYRAEAAADREEAASARDAAVWMAESAVRTSAQDGQMIIAESAAIATARAVSIVDKAQSSAAEIIDNAAVQAAAFTTGLDAIEGGELIHRPATKTHTQGLEIASVETPVLPTDPNDLHGWRRAAAPFWERLISYAARLGQVRNREATLDRVAARQSDLEKAEGIQRGPASEDARLIAITRLQPSKSSHEER